MPTPKKYAGPGELREALKLYPWRIWFEEARTRGRSSSLKEIVYGAVGSNTFRAFRHLRVPPSKVFREWALKALDDSRLQALRDIPDQAQYTAWLYDLSDSLQTFWESVQQAKMPFGPSLKLPNLLLKQLCISPEISDVVFNKIIWYLEIPLDRYTIEACANSLDPFPGRYAIGNIPSNPTMNFIKRRDIYEAFQEGIRQLARSANVPPITLDCLAWNERHSK